MRYHYLFYCLLFGCCFLAGCSPHHVPDGPPHYYVDVNKIPDAVPRKLPRGTYGNPRVYAIEGRRYHVLHSSYGYFKQGIASWYGMKFHGRLTASREPYDIYGMTAASTDLPIPSFVRVTNLANHKTVIVKVNDRGPFAANRIIDLSYAAAVKLGYANRGTASVLVQALNVDDEHPHYALYHHPYIHPPAAQLATLPQQHRQYLQLGAFHNVSYATYLKTHTAALIHKPVIILKELSHHVPLYRVLVGPVINASESTRLQLQLKKLGLTSPLIGNELMTAVTETLTWKTLLSSEKQQPYFQAILNFINTERTAGKTIYPATTDIFNALKFTPFENVKVVVLGQDPYHGPNQAHGLSFSVRPGVPLPPSLQNIFKELQADLGVPPPPHGCLEKWAKQGVLLLNAILTVQANQPQSHASIGWQRFTDQVIASLNEHPQGIVFLLWGSHAQQKTSLITNLRHHVLKAPHPSPLSAHRGFLGCRHFSQTNDLLQQMGRTPIDWRIDN